MGYSKSEHYYVVRYHQTIEDAIPQSMMIILLIYSSSKL